MDYFVGHDYYVIGDELDGYGNNRINMCNEEVRFIKAIRKFPSVADLYKKIQKT